MAWLTGWRKRVKATVKADRLTDANDLTYFPVLLYISASCGIYSEDLSCIFDELTSDDNRKKIAVTKADGETQLYVEIERWDDANEQAWLWVSKSDWVIDSETDTDLYLYYDSTHVDNTTYVGDINSTPGAAVWDSYFKGVWHLAEASGTLYDSTANNNDLTAYNTPTYGYAGKIGKCLDFNAAQIENLKRASAVVTAYPLTLEGWANLDAGSYILGIVRASSQYAAHMILFALTCNYYVCAGASTDTFCITANSVALGQWGYCVAVGHSATSRNSYLNADIANKGTSTTSRNPASLSQTQSMILDATWGANVAPGDGRVDELRISNTDRSEAWITATYETTRDNLLDWGSEEMLSRLVYAYVNPVAFALRYGTGLRLEEAYLADMAWVHRIGAGIRENIAALSIVAWVHIIAHWIAHAFVNVVGEASRLGGSSVRQPIGYLASVGEAMRHGAGIRSIWAYLVVVGQASWWRPRFISIRVSFPDRTIQVRVISKTITVSFYERTIKVR